MTTIPARRYIASGAERLIVPRLSGVPFAEEIDYDDLWVKRHWREFDVKNPGEVKYMMYELVQRDVGQVEPVHFYKAIRMIRVTRVPRYLRQAGGSIDSLFDQQRDVLAALRQEDVLFLSVIAKAPDLPLIFSYGVQATGATPEEARAMADRSYAVLSGQLDGTYQQLEYKPLTLEEAERLVRYQHEWNHLAMARGRPKPTGGSSSLGGILDGNRTDVEQTANQLESFIRGMGQSSFILELLTVPVAPVELTRAWRNLVQTLSDVRSDTDGARAVTAGISIPAGFGLGHGEGASQSHSAADSLAHGLADTESASFQESYSETASQSQTAGATVGESIAQTHGITDSIAVTHGASLSEGITAGVSHGQTVNEGVSTGVTEGQSVTHGLTAGVSEGQSVSEGASISESLTRGVSLTEGITRGQSLSESMGISQSVTMGESLSHGQSLSESMGVSEGVSQGASVSQSVGESASASVGQTRTVTSGESVSAGTTEGFSLGQGLNRGLSGSRTWTEGISRSLAESLSQTFGLSDALGDTIGDGKSIGESYDFGLRAGSVSAGATSSETDSSNRSSVNTDTISSSLTGGGSRTTGLSSSLAEALSESFGLSEEFGRNWGRNLTVGGSVSQSDGATATQGVSASRSAGVSESASVSRGVNQTVGMSESVTASQSIAQSQAQSRGVGFTTSEAASQAFGQTEAVAQAVGRTATIGQSAAQSLAQSQTAGATASQSLSQSQTAGLSASQSLSQSQTAGVSTAQSVGQSVSQSQSQSISRSQSLSETHGQSVGVSQAAGVAAGTTASMQRGMTDAYVAGMTRQAQTSGSLGLIPSVGISISRQTRDEAKRILGDILEAQVKRYVEGIESGAFFYQMALLCEDRETLARASGLLKSAFWGPGDQGRLPQPFHVVDTFDPDEAERILTHMRAFSSYRRREPRTEYVEPHLYSTYITPGEGAAFTHPPTAEASGLLAVHDSMPVFAMPSDRGGRDIHLGYVVNGERAIVSDNHFGLDLSELTHTLVAGSTGSGKTTTVLRLLSEAVQAKYQVRQRQNPNDPSSPIVTREIPAGALCLDWQKNMRALAQKVPEDRFRFFSVAKPALGEFKWNPLAIPHEDISPVEWADTVADLVMISYGLGEFGRSIIWEHINDLYSANRLEPYVLREPQADAMGVITRPGISLPAVDRDSLPEGAIQIGPNGEEYANVYTCPELSRLVGFGELAVSIMARIEQLSSPDAGRMFGTEIRNRYQSVWRRMQYFAPGGPLSRMMTRDVSLEERSCLTVTDIVDPDRGLVTVIEADGLGLDNRRLILGAVFMAVWRYGQAIGEGAFNNGGMGPGTFICLEEAHELFGSRGDNEDRETVATRTALWESIYRRSRQVGLRLIACVQNPGDIPAAIYSNSSTVLVHTLYDSADRKVIADLMNWNTQFDHRREMRYLGEMPRGWCIARLASKESYLEAAPVHFVTDPANLADVTDMDLLALAQQHR